MELERASVLLRSLWTLVWFSIVVVGTNTYGSWAIWSGFNIVGPLITFMGVVGIIGVWVVPARHYAVFEMASFCSAILAVLLSDGPILATSHSFSTDAAAFNQRATELFVRGTNPYAATFNAGHLLLNHASDYWTYTLGGGFVDKLSYPAGSFLFQAPLQLLGVRHLTTNWIDLFAWIVAASILYRISPWYAKWLSPFLVLASLFTYMFAFGGTDALFVPFMMLAALRWDSFVEPNAARWMHWLGPVSLGIACSIKQTPWFTVPFFVVGIALEAHHHDVPVPRSVARYCALVAAPFLVMNLPFIIWSPRDWFHGILLPMKQPLIPDGQGLVSLVTHGLLHVVHPFDLQIASLLCMIALLTAFYFWYPLLKRPWMFTIPLILFVPSRSLSSYLVDFIPAAFVMVLTTTRIPHEVVGRSSALLRRSLVAIPLVLAGAMIVIGFSDAPLNVHIDHFGSSVGNEYMKDLTLTLTNETNTALVPHVMVIVGSGHPVGFWNVASGSKRITLKAHSDLTVSLKPPKFMKAPAYGENWLVEVLTKSPGAMTTTSSYSWPYGRSD